MATTYRMERSGIPWGIYVLRATVVALALATAAIHAMLGGPLFTMNEIGYTTLGIAMVLPGPFLRVRWLIRLVLIAFTLATIAGWLFFGARFSLAYLDKGIELAPVLATVIELWRTDGSPIEIARRIRRLPTTLVRALGARS